MGRVRKVFREANVLGPRSSEYSRLPEILRCDNRMSLGRLALLPAATATSYNYCHNRPKSLLLVSLFLAFLRNIQQHT